MSVDAAHARTYRLLGGTADDPAFHASGWDVSDDTVSLRYRIDGLGELVETVSFPGTDLAAAAREPATAGALTVLHLAAASSYYKAVLPRRVELGAVPPSAVAMVTALLTHGLAEYAVHNHLDVAELLAYPQVRGDTATPVAPRERPDGVVVPVGGGKDSAVTAMLAVRQGWDAVAFAVNPRPSMQRTAEAVGLPLVTARRQLDPRLLAWNEAGALNGHVPVTAIVASIGCVAATLHGRGDVLLSNEASADEPTRTVDGIEVNHQYSKSSAFEMLHQRAMADATGGATRALSVLRPLPELLVAAAFARLGAPLAAVNSCNRAYSMTRERREWCGTCPKCLFVQTMLAPFTTPEAFRRATGFDALADDDLVGPLRDLTDPVRKPFECVGTVEEVQLAFDLLADDPAWSDHPAVRAIGHAGRDASGRLDAMVRATAPVTLPEPYAGALRELTADLRPEARP
jgi:UDP-N-acetyl-alpha-D-muramoyl-L-alanyl-L-glutamate epimerase